MKGGRGFGGRRSTDGKGSTICRLNQSLRQTDKEGKLSLQGPHGGNTANILNKPALCSLSPASTSMLRGFLSALSYR